MDRPAVDDPDALWKPGYEGPWHVPASTGTATDRPSGPRRQPSWVGVVAAVLVLVAVTVVVVLSARGADEESAGTEDDLDTDPTTVEVPPEWSVTFTTGSIGALTATDSDLVVLVGRPGSVVAIDRRDGTIRWTASAPGASATGLDVVDDVVLSRHVEADATGSAVAHELETGVPLWGRGLAVGERIDVIDGVPWLRTSGSTEAVPFTAREGPAVLVPAVALPRAGEPTDHVLRAVGPGSELVQDLGGATVRIVVDGATSSVTLVYRVEDDPTP